MTTLNTSDDTITNKWEEDIEVIPLRDATDKFSNYNNDAAEEPQPPDNENVFCLEEINTQECDKVIRELSPKQDTTTSTNKDGGSGTSPQSRGTDSRKHSDVVSADGRSITSDTRSYREKIRDRISMVKERAGMSVNASQKLLKENRKTTKQTALSRITNRLYQEEEEVKAALEKHRIVKENRIVKEWKRRKRENQSESKDPRHPDSSDQPNYQASIDFFAKTWGISEEANQSTHSSPIHKETSPDNIEEAAAAEEEEEETKLLAADYLGLRETMTDPTEFRQPVLIKNKLRQKMEHQLLFFPTTDAVPEEERLGQNRKPRNLKEEGLYVGAYPAVRRDNLNKYHQRLVTAKNLKWFGDDGEPIRLPDPLQKNYAKEPTFQDEDFDVDKFIFYEPPLLFNEEPAYHSPSTSLTSTASSDECYVLELEILNIVFTHHPLFSKEHVLANRLIQLYEKYGHRQKVSYTKRLSTRLEALRKARDNLLQVLKREDDEEMAKVHLQRLCRYKQEIRETRHQWMIEGKTDNQLLINLLSAWKDLKRLREIQGYVATPVKLEITQTENPNPGEWKDEIRRQLAETIEEMKQEAMMNEMEITELQEMVERITIKGDASLTVDLEQMKQKIMTAVSESMLTPGEPVLNVSMSEQRVTQDHELSNALEIQRRCLLKRSFVWYRVCYNQREVCKSSAQPLNSQFSCSINQKVTIRIQEWPEVLSILVYCDGVPNKGIFNERPLAEIFVPIPSKVQTLDGTCAENYEFSSQQEVGSGVRHSGVGSGVRFKIFPDQDDATLCIHTTAVVTCKTGWAVHDDKILCPSEQYFTYAQSRRLCTSSSAGNTITPNVSKLREWAKTAQLDPNDPSNAHLFELIKKADCNVEEKSDEFRINAVQKLFDFCSEDELTKNPRLKLLMLRDKGEIEFKNIRAVPLREWEIPKDIFKTYEKRISSPELPFDTFGLGQLEIHRAWGQHSLNMIYNRILKQCKLSQQHRTTQDVVQEEKVPSIGTLGLTFMKLLQPKRPLRPRRKGRKKIPVKGLTGQEVKVIVNVVRAFEVPVRKDVDNAQSAEDGISYNIRVRPFVEITFKDQTKRTVTADGPNPTWNQDLHFSLLGPNDSTFHVSSMRSFGDSLHLHLFDESIVDILEDDRKKSTTIHQRLDRNWLGSLRIPISTLYFNQQMEGTFQLYSPPYLLGYDRQTPSSTSDTSHLRNSTFLTLFVIVQPPLSPPEPITEHLECNEAAYLEQYLESWSKDVSKQYPNRSFKTLITDTSGKSVCVTRFFRPIDLPAIYEGNDTSAEMLARYVSLIPVSNTGALILGNFNVWLTCDQTIRLLLGEREDHAVLLCCLFMKLGLKSWLLLGNGIPHGYSAYVLTKDDSFLTSASYNIWDPVAGLKYSSLDSFSPLHNVHCLINDENIWVNIQTEELVRRTNFDVTQQSDWWPAFNRNVSAPVGSVQPAAIEYTATSSADVHLLQDKIEKYLRDSIMKWRPTLRTTWNRYCIAALRKLLPVLEREACGIKTANNSNNADHLVELQHVLSSYKVCGFPISQPFSNMESILESVKSTGVHFNENSEVEFAIAVYIHPYPNDVLSVWVYAVSLVARR